MFEIVGREVNGSCGCVLVGCGMVLVGLLFNVGYWLVWVILVG
ncbi:hypothetical protein GCM10010252_77750 [Streptomyces aureoverticillatus]|nr:hypothetical protein GCM10010252_77750 [Streptomyces aureoverticillatus]